MTSVTCRGLQQTSQGHRPVFDMRWPGRVTDLGDLPWPSTGLLEVTDFGDLLGPSTRLARSPTSVTCPGLQRASQGHRPVFDIWWPARASKGPLEVTNLGDLPGLGIVVIVVVAVVVVAFVVVVAAVAAAAATVVVVVAPFNDSRAPDIGHRTWTPGTGHWTPGTGHRTPDTGHMTLDTRYRTQDTRHWTPDTRHRTLDTGHRTLDTGPRR